MRKTIQQRNPPTPLWRNGEETASWKNEWELIFPHSRSGSFDACILGNSKVFHGCWRYDDNCCRDIRYCGNNAFYPWACRLAERSGGFRETQHNTRSIYFHSAAVTRKYSPQVYFNRRCVYFDYAYYHAHCRRINPHYVVWEPNDAGIFCLRFYRHGQ